MKKLFAKFYDPFMKSIEEVYLTEWRKELLLNAKGKVLEIGSGTGVNFPLYQNCEVVAVEPNPYMRRKAKERKRQANVPITLLEGKAECLPFPDYSFDTIVVTLVLCSVEKPNQVLVELKRVLKPGGTILFLEHVKMEQAIFSSLQHALTPVWKKICDGCHLNRNTELLIKEAGYKITSKKTHLAGFAVSLIAK